MLSWYLGWFISKPLDGPRWFIQILETSVEVWNSGDAVQYDVLPTYHGRMKRQIQVNPPNHRPPKVTKSRVKEELGNKAQKSLPMDPVQQNQKQMISVDPASFSSMLMGVFDAWYRQRFGRKDIKPVIVTTPKPTTKQVIVQKTVGGIDKKALFKEFLALAMDYFKPKENVIQKASPQKKPMLTPVKKSVVKKMPSPVKKKPIPVKEKPSPVQKKSAPIKKKSSIEKSKRVSTSSLKPGHQETSTARKRKVTDPPKITHPPVLTRKDGPAPSVGSEPQNEPAEGAENKVAGSTGKGKQGAKPKKKPPAPTAGKNSGQKKKKKTRPPKSKKPKKNRPKIDPEFLADINEVRVLQGLPELTADQVDVYGNILPVHLPTTPPTATGHDHGHSHGHSHDHSFGHHGHALDFVSPLGYGAESQIQATLQDTHRRAHAMAGPLSSDMHRELHRLLKSREMDLRRDAWDRRRYGLFNRGSVLQSVVDPELLGEFVNTEGVPVDARPFVGGVHGMR